MAALQIGGELDCGVTRDYPGQRFTVRRVAEHSYEVLEVALAPTDRSPAERTKVIVTYSELEPAEAPCVGFANGE